jgi:hypothetical protein
LQSGVLAREWRTARQKLRIMDGWGTGNLNNPL